MYIVVLDYANNCVDMITIDDSLVPDNCQEEWFEGLLESHGYKESETCWMVSDTPVQIRNLSFRSNEEVEKRRQEQIKDNKTPLNWS